MANLTTKELSALEDQLTSEKTAIAKFKHYADETTDQQLKGVLTEIACQHQAHFDKLYALLG